jgi:hypothetical protein
MEELTDSIKRPNLRIMGIEEGDPSQQKNPKCGGTHLLSSYSSKHK